MGSNKFISMVTTMLKIGFIGFGGGTALIPVIEEEIVEKNHVVTEEQFNDEVMIASITPGALPVEIASGVGYQTVGIRGMIAGATAMAFPGSFLTILFLVIFSSAGDAINTQIGYLAVGISAFIILTLIRYCTGTLQQAKNKKEWLLYLFIMLGVFLLSGEKNIYQILGLSITPIFAMSTIQILGTAFFVILFSKGELRNIKRIIPAVIIAAMYFFCVGNAHLVPLAVKPFLMGLMAVLSIIGTVQTIMGSPHQKAFAGKSLAYSVLCWVVFTFILSLPAIYITRETIRFIGTGFLSSIMSFGGGDAYLSVAQGLFVDSGAVSYKEFYSNIVSVANALPGLILCKILSGCGYAIGYHIHGSVVEGIFVAICGFGCSVAASGSIVIAVQAVYDKFENLRIFAAVKHFIRPIISGLLLNVALSLYLSSILGVASGGLTAPILCVMALFIIGFNYLLERKKGVHLLWKIILSAVISFVACNILI
ncbi:MAG: chromate transporter [Clostridiales bacterium]|nr:chromate transporter [Clostridiales bacterium]